MSSSALNKRKWTGPAPTTVRDGAAGAAVTEIKEPPTASTSKRARVSEELADEYDGPGMEEDDDEGRFFGGGLNDEQERIFEILNRHADDGAESAEAPDDVAEVRRLLAELDRAIATNQKMRLKYPGEPRRFIDSEADLDAALRALVLLTTDPAALYPELWKHEGLEQVVNLLSHENADIAAAAIQVLEELTDDDVLDGRQGEQAAATVQRLVDGLLEHQSPALLVSNLSRFDDTRPTTDDAAARDHYESDVQAIYHTLGVLENMVSIRPSVAAHIVSQTRLIPWLLSRVHRPGAVDQNQAYACELLAVLLQNDEAGRAALGASGVDVLLQVLARYRARDPGDEEEREFMENAVDTMSLALLAAPNRTAFLDAEGVELMVLLLKAKKHARAGALRILDVALSGADGGALCERFVEALGLKSLCPLLLRPQDGKGALRPREREHVLAIFSALLTNLASDSPLRVRVLAKFVEQSYTKTDCLLDIRGHAQRRLHSHEKELQADRAALLEDGVEPDDAAALLYSRRLELGLATVQWTDYLLAWLVMEDDGVRYDLTPDSSACGAPARAPRRKHVGASACAGRVRGECRAEFDGRRR